MTEQDILGIGSKLNSAYLFRKQEKKTKPSAPTITAQFVLIRPIWAMYEQGLLFIHLSLFLLFRLKSQIPESQKCIF